MVVRPEGIPYLQIQRGAISDIRGDGNAPWLKAYGDMLQSEFRSIEPWLPKECDSILDIGGGMGGIDVLLSRHFGGCHVTILDGVADKPEMTKHSTTFAHFNIAKDFLHDNGVKDVGWIDANSSQPKADRHFDLVVSLKSWCFHYPVDRYHELVCGATVLGSRVIVDIRREKLFETMHWMDLCFDHIGRAFAGVKFETHVFERPQTSD